MASRSRTSSFASSALVALLLVLAMLVAGCGSGKDGTVAELVKAEGPVEREVGEDGKWAGVRVGQKFAYGDAARTGDGNAHLTLRGGAAIKMLPSTVLRFGGAKRGNRLFVEGSIDLSGTGSYALDVGEVKLSRGGTVRITSKGGTESSVELTVGEAQIVTSRGTMDLEIGKAVDVEVAIADIVVKDLVDAGGAVADAGATPGPSDAGPTVAATDGTLEITGKRAELQRSGETTWTPLPPGASPLVPGAKLRIAAGTTARLVARGVTLELGGPGRVAIGAGLELTVESGTATVTSQGDATVAIPGGTLALAGTPQDPASAQLVVGARDTRARLVRGSGKLTGSGGDQRLSRGESATMLATGAIRLNEAIPTSFDFRVPSGETLTIHDPRPPTAVQFQLAGNCASGGIVELDEDARFRRAKVSAGREAANLFVPPGSWSYRIRCTTGGSEGPAVASGRIVVTRDAGTRALPKIRPPNDIEVDGRTWRVSYQSVMPDLRVQVKGPGSAFRLHLAQGGKAETFDAKQPTIVVPGSKLKDGTYTYWIDRDGVRDPKVSTLIIDFDQTAAQVYIEAPRDGATWGADIEVRGAVLPSWSAAVDGLAIPLDRQRRFAARVGRPAGNALAIRLSHPQRGIHYYLRRGK